MVFCPKCGKENPDDAEFCNHCGYKLSEIPKPSQSQPIPSSKPSSEEQYTSTPKQPAYSKQNIEKKTLNWNSLIMITLLIIGAMYFVIYIDFIECPNCHGISLIKEFCSVCGHDGRITILQYLVRAGLR